MLSEEGLCWGLCGAAQLQTAALAQDTCPCAQKWDLQRGLWVWQFPLISADVNSSFVHLRLESTLLGPKIRYVEMLSTTVFISCCRWVLKKQKFCLPPRHIHLLLSARWAQDGTGHLQLVKQGKISV